MKILRACLIAAVVAILLLCLGGWYAYKEYQKYANAPAPIARSGGPAVAVVSSLEGTTMLTRGSDKRAVKLHDELFTNDALEVSTTGSLAIVWPEYGRTLLDGGTKLVIKEASTDGKREKLNVRLRVEAGKIWTRLQRLLGTNSSFSAQASDVVATVRGTSFGFGFDQGNQLWVKVKESKVAMLHAPSAQSDVTEEQMLGMMAKSTLVQEGQAMEMTAGSAKWPTPRVMTDAEQRDDAFMAAGHEALTAAELHLQPDIPNLEGVDLEKLWNSLPKWLQDILRNAVDQQRASS